MQAHERRIGGGVMRGRHAIKMILGLEIAGFVFLALMIWIDECLDIPHRIFGTAPAPFNIHEATWESSAVLALGVVIFFLSRRLARRVTQLEGLLPICSFCKRIRVPNGDPYRQDSWKQVEHYINERTGSDFSHGLCPECMRRHYGEVFTAGEDITGRGEK